jgi:hypothetical protein
MRSRGFLRHLGFFVTDENGDFKVDAPLDEELTIFPDTTSNCTIVSHTKHSSNKERVEIVVRLARELSCVVLRADGGLVAEVIVDYWYVDGRHFSVPVATDRGACKVRDQSTMAAPFFRISIPGIGSSSVERFTNLESIQEPHVVVLKPEIKVTGRLVDCSGDPIPFATVRVKRVSAFLGTLDNRAYTIADVGTDVNGAFEFSLPGDKPSARYAVRAMPKSLTAPIVFLCRGSCETGSPLSINRGGSQPDIRPIPYSGTDMNLGLIRCFPSAVVSVRVDTSKQQPPFVIWLTPTDGLERSLQVIAMDSDETGTAVFTGLAPGAYFADGLRATRNSPPTLGRRGPFQVIPPSWRQWDC